MRAIYTLLSLIVVSGCVPQLATQRPTLSIGNVHQNHVVVGAGGQSIPLPEGNWKLIGYRVEGNNSNNPIGYGFLLREDGGIASGVITFMAGLTTRTSGYVASSFCERGDILHIVKNANYSGREQNCWGVNHWKMGPTNDNGDEVLQAWKYLAEHKIKVPGNMVNVTYRRASTTRVLNVIYGFNPELEGQAPSSNSNWADSDWHKARVYLDSKRMGYVDKIKQWGQQWDARVTAEFQRTIN